MFYLFVLVLGEIAVFVLALYIHINILNRFGQLYTAFTFLHCTNAKLPLAILS